VKVLYSVEGGIARLTLNRPDKRNALDAETIEAIRSALAASSTDAEVRVVVLSGAGRDFCSGGDLANLQRIRNSGVLENLEDAASLAGLFLQMRHHPRPIVAAVRGRALAGGFGLASAADLIVAAESAQFGYPEVNIGFVPAMVMAMLRRAVSEKRAFELATLGETISAQQAFEMGLINRVYPDETFDLEVAALVAKLAAKPASAVALSKQVLYQIDAQGFEAALQAGIQVNTLARMTEECQRGVDKFLERQKST
jgi:methylglutaconyl-CoA hydratase